MTHPFWEGSLKELAKELDNPNDEVSSLRQSIRQSVLSTVRASTHSDLPKGNSVLGQIYDVNIGECGDLRVESVCSGDECLRAFCNTF